jgi:hypothetical protein
MRQHDEDEIDRDRDIPLAEARFPGAPHVATVWRWATRGVIRNGQSVRLRTIKCGGRTFTKQAWADEFVAACNADNPSHQPSPTAVRARRQRQAAAAMQALATR